MATYEIASGGFVQGPRRYTFSVSGELTLPVAYALPYQFCKRGATLTSARATFTTAGTSTYTILVVSTDDSGGSSQTIINDTIAPVSGEALDLDFTNMVLPANHIIRVTITQNSGTPSTDLTIVLE